MFKNLSLTLGFVLCMGVLYSQQYSYSFSGQIDEETLSALANEMSKLDGVKEVKWRYKSERFAGEFLLFTEKSMDLSNPYPFSPRAVKELFLKFALDPLELNELTLKPN